jgi:aminopeptidase N
MSVSRKSLISSLLAGGLLVSLIGATPANAAATIALNINGVVISNANVATTPASVTVPSDNSVDAVDAVRFNLTGVDAGTTVTVAATNSFIVPVLSTTLNPVRSNSGVVSANYSVGTGTTSEFFAYTRSTELGTITISNGGSTFTYYIRGTAGPAYTMAYTPNTKPFTSTLVKQSVKVSDVFGNPVVGITPSLALINIVSTTPTSTISDGTSEFTLTYPSTAGRSALSVSIPATDVTGFAPAVKSISTFIDVVDPTGEIASATAALAAEKAALAAEKAARVADKASSDALLAAEKAARAAEKIAVESTKAAEKTASDAVLNAEKAARAADKVTADKALADEKAARAADKAASDKALATLTIRVATLTKQVSDLKALYNKLAVKFKQKTIK